jgi:DnaJ-class molecular chaperone
MLRNVLQTRTETYGMAETGMSRWEREQANRQARSGRHGRKGHRCPACRGAGQVPGITKTREGGSGTGSAYGPCPECGGTGYIADAETETGAT